jgi:hypothetical protein
LCFFHALQPGTKRLQSIVRSVKGRGKLVTTTLVTYNDLVREVRELPCPAWFSKERLPQALDRQVTSQIDPDSQFWDEMALGNLWLTLWGETSEPAPAYVRDPDVRKGINAVLTCDRIAEEHCRLDREQKNYCLELECQILTAYHAIILHFGELYYFTHCVLRKHLW